jgi:hypothetical protein
MLWSCSAIDSIARMWVFSAASSTPVIKSAAVAILTTVATLS